MTRKHQSQEEEFEDTIRDIYDMVQGAGSTRADQASALDSIADLCTEAIPDLDNSESSNEADDED